MPLAALLYASGKDVLLGTNQTEIILDVTMEFCLMIRL